MCTELTYYVSFVVSAGHMPFVFKINNTRITKNF